MLSTEINYAIIKKAFLIIFLLTISITGQAQTTQDTGHIANIFIFKTTYGFRLQGGFVNAASEHGCAGPGGFARIPIDGNPNSKEMYSAVLTAMASNNAVRINIDGCSGSHFRVLGIYVDND